MSPTRTVCAMPRCPELAVQRGVCASHRRTTSQRGYGITHQQARERLERTLPVACAYGCGAQLTRSGQWVAAHVVDGDTSGGWVAACLLCNERAKRGRLRPVAGARVVHLRDTDMPSSAEVFA